MISKWISNNFNRIWNRIALVFASLGFTPNGITLLSFSIQCIACGVLLICKDLRLFSVIVILGLLLDYIDGALARMKNLQSSMGALLDSVLDRLGEAVILLSLGLFYDRLVIFSIILSLSLIISYIKAVAISIEPSTRKKKWNDLMQRDERMITIIGLVALDALLSVNIVVYIIFLWIILGLCCFTVIQRGIRAYTYLR